MKKFKNVRAVFCVAANHKSSNKNSTNKIARIYCFDCEYTLARKWQLLVFLDVFYVRKNFERIKEELKNMRIVDNYKK